MFRVTNRSTVFQMVWLQDVVKMTLQTFGSAVGLLKISLKLFLVTWHICLFLPLFTLKKWASTSDVKLKNFIRTGYITHSRQYIYALLENGFNLCPIYLSQPVYLHRITLLWLILFYILNTIDIWPSFKTCSYTAFATACLGMCDFCCFDLLFYKVPLRKEKVNLMYLLARFTIDQNITLPPLIVFCVSRNQDNDFFLLWSRWLWMNELALQVVEGKEIFLFTKALVLLIALPLFSYIVIIFYCYVFASVY